MARANLIDMSSNHTSVIKLYFDRLILQALQPEYQVSMASHCLTVEQKLSLLQRNFSILTSYHNSVFESLDSCGP